MRAVIDTNIIVSRYLTPGGLASQVLALWRDDAFELIVSEAILAEVRDVLLRPSIRVRHRMPEDMVDQVIDGFRQFATLVAPEEPIQASEDPDDDKFLECAVAGGADVIVSRDPHLLSLKQFRGVRVLSPAAFVEVLGSTGP
jgi:putative PIN family toxin of toxin-antitoxin system